MPQLIECPTCQKKFKLPDRPPATFTCTGCQTVMDLSGFRETAPEAPPAAAAATGGVARTSSRTSAGAGGRPSKSRGGAAPSSGARSSRSSASAGRRARGAGDDDGDERAPEKKPNTALVVSLVGLVVVGGIAFLALRTKERATTPGPAVAGAPTDAGMAGAPAMAAEPAMTEPAMEDPATPPPAKYVSPGKVQFHPVDHHPDATPEERTKIDELMQKAIFENAGSDSREAERQLVAIGMKAAPRLINVFSTIKMGEGFDDRIGKIGCSVADGILRRIDGYIERSLSPKNTPIKPQSETTWVEKVARYWLVVVGQREVEDPAEALGPAHRRQQRRRGRRAGHGPGHGRGPGRREVASRGRRAAQGGAGGAGAPGRAPVPAVLALPPRGRPARRDRGARRGRRGRAPPSGAARRHRIRARRSRSRTSIARLGRPTLILAPNKTLAAQLFDEFRELFPENAVEYFVSFYDYYQPEAYMPSADLYIEKDSSINDRIDRMRHSATRAVLTRRDTIVVASVSCIYALGSPAEYAAMHVALRAGERLDRDEVIRRLVKIQYRREDFDRGRGTFRVRGDVLEVGPADRDDRVVRIEWFGDEIERMEEIDPLTGEVLRAVPEAAFYPSSHYVTQEEALDRAVGVIEAELEERIRHFRYAKRPLEADRIARRTRYDLELLRETGFCPGIENYSSHLDGRAPGEAPWTLLDYFPEDFLLVVDESHVTIPQVGGMFRGDRVRKETLVEYGFRLPCALDNRPAAVRRVRGARPADDLRLGDARDLGSARRRGGIGAEQVIRPTGLVDPPVFVRPARNQVDDVLHEIRARAARNERVLVTTLTKRMAEELTEHLSEVGVKVRYLHSDVTTLERADILKDLRLGVFDVLVGINLLREGLDLPEVSLVAVLDADREGFLRSETSLVQTAGRAARNLNGQVIFYADTETRSMRAALAEMARRRVKPDGAQRRARHRAAQHRARRARHGGGGLRRPRLRRRHGARRGRSAGGTRSRGAAAGRRGRHEEGREGDALRGCVEVPRRDAADRTPAPPRRRRARRTAGRRGDARRVGRGSRPGGAAREGRGLPTTP